MNRRNMLSALAAGLAAPAVVTPAMATTTPKDDTTILLEALAKSDVVRLEARTYRIRPDVLKIDRPYQRLIGVGGHAGVEGGSRLVLDGAGGTLLNIRSHGVVVEGVGFTGPADRLIHVERAPAAHGDIDVQIIACTLSGATTGLSTRGRGVFARSSWFSHNKRHILLDFPTAHELANPRHEWQTEMGGARKVHIDGCYFHHGSQASVWVVSPHLHGVQVVGCHHDGPQPLVVGHLNMATVSGNTVYRLRHAGIVLLGKSEGVSITGNAFAGGRNSKPMGPAVSVRSDIAAAAITGNVRTGGRGPGIKTRNDIMPRGIVHMNAWGNER
jgi:hypothetical protein